jgi:hypothetical protein
LSKEVSIKPKRLFDPEKSSHVFGHSEIVMENYNTDVSIRSLFCCPMLHKAREQNQMVEKEKAHVINEERGNAVVASCQRQQCPAAEDLATEGTYRKVPSTGLDSKAGVCLSSAFSHSWTVSFTSLCLSLFTCKVRTKTVAL